jgi:hypothetical protein
LHGAVKLATVTAFAPSFDDATIWNRLAAFAATVGGVLS